MIRRIVEQPGIGLDRLNCKRVDLPVRFAQAESESIEALPDIGSFAERDESAAAECNLLAPDPQQCVLVGLSEQSYIDEALIDVEFIFVGRSYCRFTVREAALQLEKQSNARSKMEVRVHHVSL